MGLSFSKAWAGVENLRSLFSTVQRRFVALRYAL